MDVLKFESTEITPSKCPHCGVEHEMASGDGQPSEGDVSICIKCAGISVFDKGLSRRMATPEEIKNIASDERVALMRAAILLRSGKKNKH